MMDIPMVDEILLNSLSETIPDLGNIDIDKFDQKMTESPSSISCDSLSVTSVSSPSKTSTSASPHLINYNQQQSAQQQAQQQPQQQQQQHTQINMQRKVQLGPNFDRLGILNQMNDVPQQIAAPFFAKALQQHGSTTLGSLLQAHQHAIQQQMQRENYLLQQVQHPMFQNMTFNNVYQQQQQQQHQQQHQQQQRVNHSILMDRRSDDQIVPNSQILPSPDHWMQTHRQQQQRQQLQHNQQQPQQQQHQQQQHQQQLKHQQQQVANKANIKQEGDSRQEMHNGGKQKSPDKYFIFNNENNPNNDEEHKTIMPPKNSVFVRYHPESNRKLPSFSEAFSNYVEKLKMKEHYLKSVFQQQQGNAQIAQAQYYRQMFAPQHIPQMAFQFHQAPQGYIFPQQIPHPNLNMVRERPPLDIEIVGERKKRKTSHHNSKHYHKINDNITMSKEIKTSESLTTTQLVVLSKDKQKTEEQRIQEKPIEIQLENENPSNNENNNETHVKEEVRHSADIIKIAARNIINIDPEESSDNKEEDTSNGNLDLEFLNETTKNCEETQSYNENDEQPKALHTSEQTTESGSCKIEDETTPVGTTKIEGPIEILADKDKNEVQKKDSIDIFHEELQLTSEQNYDNLFNGNSDEHYFQAFRDNNLPLFTSLQEKTDANEDIAKLLHSPLDFLNEKFLN